MTPQFTPEQEVRRGHDAARIIGDAMYQESWAMLIERLNSERDKVMTTPERAEYLRGMVIAIKTSRGYLEQIMKGGKMAADAVEQQRTFTQRVMDKIR